jgi:hypothetical protein
VSCGRTDAFMHSAPSIHWLCRTFSAIRKLIVMREVIWSLILLPITNSIKAHSLSNAFAQYEQVQFPGNACYFRALGLCKCRRIYK